MLELEHEFRATDIHARLDPDEEAAAARGRNVTADKLEREMHQAGVVSAVVSPGPRPKDEGYIRANNAVARLSVDRPFHAFARLNGPRDPGSTAVSRLRNATASPADHHTAPEEVEQYAYDDRFHGFTLAPAYDGLPDGAVLDELESVGAPVLVHAGINFPPSAVADHLLGYSFPVVLAAFGGDPLNRDLMQESLRLLSVHDDLYLDTCAVRYRDVLERGLLEHPDRIVFGSGAPGVHPNVAVMELLTLDVSADAMRRAFAKNPARLVDALGPSDD
ncbi:MAG: amidohydrolase family protein [Halolamina sp.]